MLTRHDFKFASLYSANIPGATPIFTVRANIARHWTIPTHCTDGTGRIPPRRGAPINLDLACFFSAGG